MTLNPGLRASLEKRLGAPAKCHLCGDHVTELTLPIHLYVRHDHYIASRDALTKMVQEAPGLKPIDYAAMLGLSRRTVYAALRALEADGTLKVVRGKRGVVKAVFPSWQEMDNKDKQEKQATRKQEKKKQQSDTDTIITIQAVKGADGNLYAVIDNHLVRVDTSTVG